MQTIDVWRATLDRSADEIAELYELLDERERNRAAKYYKVDDRRRFIAARGTLRTLLGEYTATPPEDVSIVVRPGGKPSLNRERHSNCVHFSLSHCGDLGLFAIADREVGIDLQLIEEMSGIAAIVANFFSESEAKAFNRLETAERNQFFYRTWVRKEAYVKATGEGLAADPRKVCVGANADGTTIDKYVILDIPDVNDHAASIAVEAGEHPRVICIREWPSLDRDLEK